MVATGSASYEMHIRQRAVRLRLAGRSVTTICQIVGRSREWFYTWWRRYDAQGPPGLRDVSRAPQHGAGRMSDDLRRMILSIRDRLMRRQGPHERYRYAGAPTIRYELEQLGVPAAELPSVRAIERVLQTSGRTGRAFRPRPAVTTPDYPAPHATRSNQMHQLDLVGPRYLKGSRRHWYYLVYKDTYDQSVYLEFQHAPQLDDVLAFVVRAWQQLGLPDILQVDNDERFGLTSHPGSLGRFIRLALRVGVHLYFAPEHEPWRNGSVENFNGWFQPRLLAIRLQGPAQVRRELTALMHTCYYEHIHAHLGFRTPAQVRQGIAATLRRLPAGFVQHQQPLPIAIGRVSFLRRVRRSGRITVLGVKVHVHKRLAGCYVQATLYTGAMALRLYHHRHRLKQVRFPFRGATLL